MSRSWVIMSCMTTVHDFLGWSCEVRALCVVCRPWRSKNMTSRFGSLTEQDIEKNSWRQGPFFCWIYNKTIIRFGFVISRIIKVSVRVISLSLGLQLITPTLTLIILDITKTSSNDYLLAARNAGFLVSLINVVQDKLHTVPLSSLLSPPPGSCLGRLEGWPLIWK